MPTSRLNPAPGYPRPALAALALALGLAGASHSAIAAMGPGPDAPPPQVPHGQQPGAQVPEGTPQIPGEPRQAPIPPRPPAPPRPGEPGVPEAPEMPGIPGVPGIPGIPGTPGVPGQPGARAPSGVRVDIADFSVVELRGKGLHNARTTALGPNRQGGGIVIDDDGLILTIGYLIIETEQIEVLGRKGERIPAAMIAYDNDTGLGLVRAAAPLNVPPVALADSADVKVSDPVLVVGFDGVAPAYVVSRRPYTGSWEYLMNDALYTAPATTGWSGAALLNNQGRLVGIGSQLVPDALGASRSLPGNMFVPVDALKPILDDLVAKGRRDGDARPWLGVNVQDLKGKLLVTRVAEDGPAQRSGIAEGDIIVGLAGNPLKDSADFYTRLWKTGRAGVKVNLDVVKGVAVQQVAVDTMDRADYLRPPAMY